MPAGKNKDDLLGASSYHKRSSHAKDEFCSVTVRKDDPKEKAGIRLEQEANGRVRVSNIASNGLFASSEIEIGDIVLSINGKRLSAGEGPEALVEVVNQAKSAVTVVVKKSNIKPRKEKPVKDMNGVQDNNVTKIDSYYDGKAKHNADGSLCLKYDAKDKQLERKVEATTISATKKSDGDDCGLVFAVYNKMLFVDEMTPDSIFSDTDLEVGDRILSINDMNFRTYVDAKYAQVVARKAKKGMTLLVEKQALGFDKQGHKSQSKKDNKPKRSPEKQPSDSDMSSTQSSSSNDDKLDSLKSLKFKEVVIAAPKAFAKQEVGLTFETRKDCLIIFDIKPNSIFFKTSLEEGDRILAVNDVDFRHSFDKFAARRACHEAKESVSLLVQKDVSKYAKAQFNLDASSTNLDWQ